MTVWVVIWVVLMMFWLFFGCWWTWEPQRPAALGSTIIPWLCVLILGLILFGAIPPGPIRY
jgi:hypothetical protein